MHMLARKALVLCLVATFFVVIFGGIIGVWLPYAEKNLDSRTFLMQVPFVLLIGSVLGVSFLKILKRIAP